MNEIKVAKLAYCINNFATTNVYDVNMKENKKNTLMKLIKIVALTLALVITVVVSNEVHADASVASTKQTVLGVAKKYYRWNGSQQYYLDRIISRESGWKLNARNGRYYGLFQTTNVWDKSVMGQCWKGMNYIRARYGTPSNAWRHVLKTGWY